MIKLAHCIICKGDEDLSSLKYLFHNLDGIFNSVHITANGENTTELEKWCKEKGFDYSYLKWNDNFSEQRNFNFARAPKDADYIVWSDSDDVIVHPEELVRCAEIGKRGGHKVVFFEYWYASKFKGKPSLETFVEPEIIHMRERFIQPGSIHWVKRIHETPLPYEEKYSYSQVKYSDEFPVAWMHLGATQDLTTEKMKERMNRNQRLLELELADERKTNKVDPRTILYLMKIYAEDDDLKLVKELQPLGEEYLSKSGWDEERAQCFRLMAMGKGKEGKHEESAELLLKAIKEYPYDPLTYLHLARSYLNLQDFGKMRHYLELGLSLDEKKEGRVAFDNILEMKVLGAELMLKYFYLGDNKNVRKAYEAAKLLNSVHPTKQNQEAELMLADLKDLDEASENAHKLFLYLSNINRQDLVPKVYDSLPVEMQHLPFANHFNNKYREPKVWADNEICYYASFGANHFEQWSPLSLQKGIGGSETAVIKLTRLWAQKGYKVTVYADPGQLEGNHEGVLWLPWFKFNPKDKFNIFIQWRSNSFAGKISAKKYLVDLHDVFYEGSYLDNKDAIDSLMVKSNYHRKFALNLPDDKFRIIGNGIEL